MSWPAAWAYMPSWPHPVIRPKTNFGLRAWHTSGPTPKRSITPGRKPSMRPSAFSTNCNKASTPSGLFRSSAILRRPRSMRSPAGVAGAGPRTACARSTRITSAPMSASNMAANGPGPMPAISIILYPDNGPDITLLMVKNCFSCDDVREPRWHQQKLATTDVDNRGPYLK